MRDERLLNHGSGPDLTAPQVAEIWRGASRVWQHLGLDDLVNAGETIYAVTETAGTPCRAARSATLRELLRGLDFNGLILARKASGSR